VFTFFCMEACSIKYIIVSLLIYARISGARIINRLWRRRGEAAERLGRLGVHITFPTKRQLRSEVSCVSVLVAAPFEVS